jgi:hypothetical protein
MTVIALSAPSKKRSASCKGAGVKIGSLRCDRSQGASPLRGWRQPALDFSLAPAGIQLRGADAPLKTKTSRVGQIGCAQVGHSDWTQSPMSPCGRVRYLFYIFLQSIILPCRYLHLSAYFKRKTILLLEGRIWRGIKGGVEIANVSIFFAKNIVERADCHPYLNS